MKQAPNHKTAKTGDELLSNHGDPIGYRLRDFWQWSVSDLVSNATRGRLAEFIVATTLQVNVKEVRDEWQAYDLTTTDGIKIEVKSAAYLQSWNQKRPSSITYSIKLSHHWDGESNTQAKESKRHADVYVFCLLKHMDKETIDPLRLEQWDFFVLSERDLKNYRRSQHSISLRSLQKLSPTHAYADLRNAVIEKNRQNIG
jgi:hypothetical protein